MKNRMKGLENFSSKEKVDREKVIVYHSDTTSVATFGKINDFNIYYSWTKPLEEPSNKEIHAHIKSEK